MYVGGSTDTGSIFCTQAVAAGGDRVRAVKDVDDFILTNLTTRLGYDHRAAETTPRDPADGWSAALFDGGRPVIALARGASASVDERTAEMLADDRITAVARNTNLVDPGVNNLVGPDDGYRYHVHLLRADEENGPGPSRNPALAPQDLRKLLTGFTLATYPRLKRIARRRWKPKAPRAIDVSFVGKATHDVPEIARHRLRAAAMLDELGRSGRFEVHVKLTKADGGPGYPKKQFYRVLAESKVAISPWGFGEVCIRDFEAILAGCVMIKPDMGHALTDPLVYRKGETYLACRRDFADVPDLVADVVNRWEHFRDMRQHAYEAVQAARDPQVVAAQVAALIRRGVAMGHP